jgi:molybdopterin converting factor small subunit
VAAVYLTAVLRPLAGGISPVRVAGGTLREVIEDLQRQHPDLRGRILDAGGIRPEVFIAVGSVETDNLGMVIGEDTEVHVLPAIAGG